MTLPWAMTRTREEKADLWRRFSSCCSDMADALESGDEILGVLTARSLAYTAAEFEIDFWFVFRQEIDTARDELREMAKDAEAPDVATYLARLDAANR